METKQSKENSQMGNDETLTAENVWCKANWCCVQTIDRFNGLSVTAFVTPGNARFLMLHDGKSDDSIRTFFSEVYELYLRVRVCVGCGDGRLECWYQRWLGKGVCSTKLQLHVVLVYGCLLELRLSSVLIATAYQVDRGGHVH